MDIDKISRPFSRIICLSLTEVFGNSETQEILSCLNRNNEIDAKKEFNTYLFINSLGDWFAKKFDHLTAKGIWIRIGRASLNHIRREYPKILDLGMIKNRLKPISSRFKFSLSILCKVISEELCVEIRPREIISREFQWEIYKSTSIYQTFDYLPYYLFGLLEEFCNWLDSRKDYRLAILEDERSNKIAIQLQIMDLD